MNVFVRDQTINTVFACNDDMALGAARAARDIPRDTNGSLVIMGCDPTAPCRAHVAAGMLSSTLSSATDHACSPGWTERDRHLKLLAVMHKPIQSHC